MRSCFSIFFLIIDLPLMIHFHVYSFFLIIIVPLTIHFHVHSNAKKPSCFYPVPQAADCILRVVERANAPVIYLSTDAAESETGLLQSLVVQNGRPIPLVKRPARNKAEKWDALLYRHRIGGDPQVWWHCFFSSSGFELESRLYLTSIYETISIFQIVTNIQKFC